MPNIRVIRTSQAEASAEIKKLREPLLLDSLILDDPPEAQTVRQIIADVRNRGDQAVSDITKRVDKADIPPDSINCVGCTELEGVHIGHCAECKIRTCGLAKGVANCALCGDYPCEMISGFIAKVPPARANLEEIRSAKGH